MTLTVRPLGITLTVNTIEFNGQKAVINSYSGLYVGALGMASIDAQRERWAAEYPNAIVRTETLTDRDTWEIVAAQNARTAPGHCACHDIGKASNAA